MVTICFFNPGIALVGIFTFKMTLLLGIKSQWKLYPKVNEKFFGHDFVAEKFINLVEMMQRLLLPLNFLVMSFAIQAQTCYSEYTCINKIFASSKIDLEGALHQTSSSQQNKKNQRKK
ncbi:hypothetical protein CNR22_02375 [Sphingobacteriaceae bacterium]|nr:hypothetical protein CNR22_02375 [Sphingobacteriaceae bacterium]